MSANSTYFDNDCGFHAAAAIGLRGKSATIEPRRLSWSKSGSASRLSVGERTKLLQEWLCHSDARQVFDLPAAVRLFPGSLTPWSRSQTESLEDSSPASQRLAAHRSGRARARVVRFSIVSLS